MDLNCKNCTHYKTYCCPHLYDKNSTKDISKCYFGIMKKVTKQDLIELKMIGVCGREEYREIITKEVMTLTDEEVVKEYNEEIKFYY